MQSSFAFALSADSPRPGSKKLNFGAALITDRDEKEHAATLNLRAGRKAKASTAYASACIYLSAGMSLIGREIFDNPSQYELAFALRLERAECELLSGNFDEAERPFRLTLGVKVKGLGNPLPCRTHERL